MAAVAAAIDHLLNERKRGISGQKRATSGDVHLGDSAHEYSADLTVEHRGWVNGNAAARTPPFVAPTPGFDSPQRPGGWGAGTPTTSATGRPGWTS